MNAEEVLGLVAIQRELRAELQRIDDRLGEIVGSAELPHESPTIPSALQKQINNLILLRLINHNAPITKASARVKLLGNPRFSSKSVDNFLGNRLRSSSPHIIMSRRGLIGGLSDLGKARLAQLETALRMQKV